MGWFQSVAIFLIILLIIFVIISSTKEKNIVEHKVLIDKNNECVNIIPKHPEACILSPLALNECDKSCAEYYDKIKDEHEKCDEWANKPISECLANPKYMLSKCALSCKKFIETALDKNTQCSEWADSRIPSECNKNPNYMLANCPRSCFRFALDKLKI
jgi:hypothetical protein